jgi:hypothetical protein
MIDQSRLIVLNDEQCAVLGPLVDVCRPRGKTEPVALREHFYLVITAGGADSIPLLMQSLGRAMSRMLTGCTAARGRCGRGGTNRPSSTARGMYSSSIAKSNPTQSALIWFPGPKTIPGRATGTTPWRSRTRCFVITRPTRHSAPPSPPAEPHIANCSAPV